MDKPAVRQALGLAIDREAIVNNLLKGGQVPTATVVPDGLAGYKGLKPKLFDPVRGRQLLREAGYGPGNPLPQITLKYNTSEGHKQLAESIQAMWKENLGIDVVLENMEWSVFLGAMKSGAFQVGRMGWIGDYPDPNTFLDIFLSSNPGNVTGFANPDYDALLAEANQTLDAGVRMKKLRKAESMLMNASPILPIYFYSTTKLVKPYVRGFHENLQGRHDFKHMWIEAPVGATSVSIKGDL